MLLVAQIVMSKMSTMRHNRNQNALREFQMTKLKCQMKLKVQMTKHTHADKFWAFSHLDFI
jgi:hypothetical protein